MRPPHPRVTLAVLIVALLVETLAGCSRIQIAYGASAFVIKRYANEYLDLNPDQVAAWEPQLEAALDEHRAVELPQLAGFFDALHQASAGGFDQTNTRCLISAFRELYLHHARLAVRLAAPLLAGLDPRQVQHLNQTFAADEAEDRITPETRNPARELRKRARRYVRSIEDWTGPLDTSQRALVADITARMPDTAEAVQEYRSHQRKELIELLGSGAAEPQVRRFLTDWLVDYRDLPPALTAAGEQISERVGELLIRLGGSLDQTQRRHLDDRLATLRDDLMKLQKAPRMVPPNCTA